MVDDCQLAIAGSFPHQQGLVHGWVDLQQGQQTSIVTVLLGNLVISISCFIIRDIYIYQNVTI
jgi:hypothetical protein